MFLQHRIGLAERLGTPLSRFMQSVRLLVTGVPQPYRRGLLAVGLVCGAVPLRGQTPTPTPTKVAPNAAQPAIPGIPKKPDLVTVVPFQLGRSSIYIHAAIDGREGLYILDTGSPMPVLAPQPGMPGDSGGGMAQTTVHTLRIGTLNTTLSHTPLDPQGGNALVFDHPVFHKDNTEPVLGTIGLNTMFPFEMILDFPHQRLIVVRLDSAGHRRVPLPAYTPVMTMPILLDGKEGVHTYLFVQAGDVHEAFYLDTGLGATVLKSDTRDMLKTHLIQDSTGATFLDHALIGGQSFDKMQVGYSSVNGLGLPFFRLLGVVGINLQTKQLAVYH